MYLETTVFNYYFDEDRKGHEDVVRLFEAIGNGKFEPYTSNYVIDELEEAQEPKRTNMRALIEDYNIKVLDTSSKIRRLGRLYIEKGVIPRSCIFDSLHVATASVYNLTYIVSYNFRHINRAKTQIGTMTINKEEGYDTIIIATAGEVLGDE